MPAMSKSSIETVLASSIQKKKTYLEAVKSHGSPLYILEPEVLAQKARQFKNAFESELSKIKCYFAMKSNNMPLISGILVQNGFGIDVSSGLELAAALSINAEDIVFSGPGKTEKELLMAIENSSKTTLLLDSFGELKRLEKLVHDLDRPLAVGVRLNNNPTGLWRKFGIPLSRLSDFYNEAKAIPNICFKGLQFHSSWNLEPDRQIEFIEILGTHLKTMPEDFLNALEFIDIGGGYWPPQGEWLVSENPLEHYALPAQSIESFAGRLAQALKSNILHRVDCTICLEPGRWICNDAMHLLIQVIDKKEEDLVITDAGTNTIGWERFESDYFPVINLSNFENRERPCHILGSLCTPHDVWGYAYFGKSISEGDILMIPMQGAYTYSLRQQFIKPLPRVVAAEERGLFTETEFQKTWNF
ncbi:diaminopimelate decarboxylase family protein [Desulfospira joergensenii]|uniref:diaminopimelate decarboxylase family protein n=1 Tax=Desulfospira joergensenii TaxID=53329 RepID=UPI001FCA068D|nr:decarboxylase [Desulfospira joergensenii]